MHRSKTHIVSLIGAGPGDPGLITVRGLQRIREADVVVFDQLGAPALLDNARPGAELIDVGKRAGDHTLPQEKINELLVQKAKEGKRVVRLKGGDPHIFGRGGEEMETLASEGIGFEVIPGVSSAIAGPAYAGIPITHRSCTASLAIATGHEADDTAESRVPWESLAHIGSVVILMGVGRLEAIVERLRKAGRRSTTPVALIEQATTPKQRTTIGTLADIVEKARDAKVKPPALIVIGEVVRYHERLSWFERRPLHGRTIVVTRSRAQASDLVQALSDLGANVLTAPAIKIEKLDQNPGFDDFLKHISEFKYLVFTSVNGVDGFVDTLIERKKDLRDLAAKTIICIGPATADAFRRRGITPDFVPDTFVAEALIPYFQERKPEGVAILRAEKAREVLPDALRELKYKVEVIPLYKTKLDGSAGESVIAALRAGTVDAVTFTSSSTVDNFIEMLAGTGIEPASIPGAAIGPVTAATCAEKNVRLVAESSVHTIPGLVDALLARFGK
ncbi:MAG: uroporphyrinogen-III C-methyltransferase [Candidatus Riflebacteria bacterium]|nr:uroporphyrinogen-III C-methyltransferase [Candidatus Riflebacteria bacterium]